MTFWVKSWRTWRMIKAEKTLKSFRVNFFLFHFTSSQPWSLSGEVDGNFPNYDFMQEYLLPSLLMCTENKRCRSKIHSRGKVTRQMPKVIHRKSLQVWIHSYLMSPPVLSLKGKRPFKTIPVGFHWNVHLCKYKYPGPTVSAVSGRFKMVITDTSFFTIKTSPANAISSFISLIWLWTT